MLNIKRFNLPREGVGIFLVLIVFAGAWYYTEQQEQGVKSIDHAALNICLEAGRGETLCIAEISAIQQTTIASEIKVPLSTHVKYEAQR